MKERFDCTFYAKKETICIETPHGNNVFEYND